MGLRSLIIKALLKKNKETLLKVSSTLLCNKVAKLVGLSRSSGLEHITVTQNFGEGNVEKTVRLFDFDYPDSNSCLNSVYT